MDRKLKMTLGIVVAIVTLITTIAWMTVQEEGTAWLVMFFLGLYFVISSR